MHQRHKILAVLLLLTMRAEAQTPATQTPVLQTPVLQTPEPRPSGAKPRDAGAAKAGGESAARRGSEAKPRAAAPEPAPIAAAPPGSDREQAARQRVEQAERLRAVEMDAQREATETAAAALAEEKKLTTAQSEAFARLKAAGAAVDQMTRHLADIEDSKAEARKRIDRRAALLRPMMPLMVRLSAFPIETLLASGLPAEQAVRGVIVLRGLAHQAEVETRSLAEDQKALEAATRSSEELLPKLAAAKVERAREAEDLAQKLKSARDRRQGAEQDAADAARHAAAEAARAKNLQSMLQVLVMQRRLEEAQAKEDALRADRDQRLTAADAARLRQAALSQPAGAGALSAGARPTGQLVTPIAGTLVRGWGDPEDGEPATGMSWQTRAGAAVVAPCGGTVAYADSFRGYGLLIIIDCGGQYHAVLSGLEQAAVAPGKAVQSGDTVGAMRTETSAAIRAAEGNAFVPPMLYFELRKGGRPVNPAPWLRRAS